MPLSMQETSIETKGCKKCWVSFDITDKDLEFYDKISPIFAWQKYSIPTPTFCPDCRQQRRLTWRNEMKLYRRNCDFSNKPIISVYSQDSINTVYDKEIWRSDKWDPLDYGKDFDFSKTFFEQFAEISQKTPKVWMLNSNTENADYWNDVEAVKNSYLTFNWAFSEHLCYVHSFFECRDCLDCDWIINNCELCYDSYKLESCYKCFFSYFCSDSTDCIFCYDCHWCKDCIWCVNLYNKQYYVFNKQLSKDEYQKYISNLNLGDYETLKDFKEKFLKFKLSNIHRNIRIKNCTNCEWDNLLNSSECSHSYDWFNLVNGKYAWNCWGSYIYDSYNTWNTWDFAYENIANYRIYKTFFVSHSWGSKFLFYCEYCFSSENLFWCSWLRDKKYCILNKQYTKDEYEKLVPLLIEHMKTTWEWGEFFPSSISPFGYNETIANEYFPLEKKEAIKNWFKWMDKEYPVNIPEWMARINAKDLPELKDLNSKLEKEILTTAIICEDSWKPYRIIKPELDFYKKHNIALPRKHQDIRQLERLKFRNPRKLFDRKCDKCDLDMKTTYESNRPESIFCQSCYEKEVY